MTTTKPRCCSRRFTVAAAIAMFAVAVVLLAPPCPASATERPAAGARERAALRQGARLAWRVLRRCPGLRGGLTTRCVVLASMRVEGAWFVVDVREQHNERCGGDPGTMPRMQTLRIESGRGRVWVEDIIEGEHVRLSSSRGKKLCKSGAAAL
jgi:hypothetical protein